MPERTPRADDPLTESELEAGLRDLGARIAFPATPPIAEAVRARLSAGVSPVPPRTARPGRWRWLAVAGPGSGARWPLAAAVALLVLAAVLALSADLRGAVADRLGVRGIDVAWVPGVPTPAFAPTPGPTPADAGAQLGLGRRVELAEARATVPFAPRLPAELGEPDEVYIAGAGELARVSFVWHARPGLPAANPTGVGALLTEFRGELLPELAGKGLPPPTSLREVRVGGMAGVGGQRGLWIEGEPHMFWFRGPSGEPIPEQTRLAGNTLLWEGDGLTLRLESALDLENALRVAGSLR